MLFLVKDILDFSQIESRSFILNPEDCNVQQMIEECIDLFKFKANEKRINLHYTILGGGRDESLLPQIRTDQNRVKQIIINLVSNALKFTQKGSVHIAIELKQEKGYISISVSDTGVGMTRG